MNIISSFDDSLLDEVKIEIFDGIKVSHKSVSYADYVSALQSALNPSVDHYHLGLMPYGFLDGTITHKNPGNFNAILILPAQTCHLLYFTAVYQVPMPSLVFFFKVIDGTLNKSSCFAIKPGHDVKNPELYHYPYGNVHLSGEICWGNVVIDPIKNFFDLNKLIALFHGSEMDGDLYIPNPQSPTLRELLISLQGQEAYPDNLLLTAKKNLSCIKKQL